MKRFWLLIALGVFFMPLYSRKDTIYPKKICATAEVDDPPEIDGWINDEAWEKVPWEGNFHMFDPYDDRPATQNTVFKILFDTENIYIALRAFDTAPDSIVRRLTRRDNLDGDFLAFQFDSYHDLQTAFTFFVSAAGSKMDAYETGNGENMDDTWNPVWWTETQIDDQGWTMEAKIPFSQLRFDRSGQGIWGLQVARYVFRNGETSLWQPISKEAPGWIHLIGELHGLESIDPKKQAEILPYVVAGTERFEKVADDPFLAKGNARLFNAGLDAKIGITNNFTLDLTVNPDFGQVESDPSQVNLTAFETYFEEQRPFFIEGKNIFNFDLGVSNMSNLFYSRRIGRRPQHHPDLEEGEYVLIPDFTKIIGAAKITGKTKDGLSVGIMESVTADEKAEIDFGEERRFETVEPITNYFAGSVSREFQKGNTILGGMITSTNRFNDEIQLDHLHSSAFSGGIDFKKYFSGRSYILSLSAYMSQVRGSQEAMIRTQRSPVRYFQRPDADYITYDSARTSLSGYGANLQFGKQSGKLNFMTFIYLNSPGLELNDIGFLNATDEILEIFWVGYSFNEPFSVFRSMHLNVNQYSCWDFGGRHQVLGFNVNGQAEFRNFWHAGFFGNINSEVSANSPLRGGPAIKLPGDYSLSASLSTSSTKKVIANFNGSCSRDFEKSGLNCSMNFGLTYKPISNLSLSLEPGFSYNQNELQYVSQEEFDSDPRYIFGSIDQKTLCMSLRIDLIITPEITLQFWGQPFIASGSYSDFKYISDPQADNFRNRFHTYTPGEVEYLESEDIFLINEPARSLRYEFDNPDFNMKEFLSNLVFRWEYRPGSFIYLVWTQNRSGLDPYGRFCLKNDLSDMWDIFPNDVLMIKVSYRMGR